MTRFKLPFLLLVATISASAWGQCLTPAANPGGPITPGTTPVLVFDPVDGAEQYQIEAYDSTEDAWFILGRTGSTEYTLPPLVFASNQDLRIRVVAHGFGPSATPLCVAETRVEFLADMKLREQFGKIVLPVAGALEGAYGSSWRTILSLSNNLPNAFLQGRIVFHPAGTVASDQNPSLRYSLRPNEVKQWPDIVSALGATGLGSIDIIPEDTGADRNLPLGGVAPIIQARIVNDAEDATFGTNVDAVFVRDLAPAQLRRFHGSEVPTAEFASGVGSTIIVPEDAEHTRLNIGFRYFDFPELYRLLPLDPAGPFVQLALRRDGEFIEGVIREFPAGYMDQVPVDQIFDNAVEAGDAIVIRAISALVYWTLTDNRTNDPVFFFDPYSGVSKRIVYE